MCEIFHGSDKIVSRPIFGAGKEYNDYGRGFYCTREIDLAREWACQTPADGFVNKYELDESELNILNLLEEKYSILHWITMLIENRQFNIKNPVAERGFHWLTANYHLDISDYDMVRGYRADDSYFSFARAFLQNEITIQQLENAIKLGSLGQQDVLISRKAFEAIEFMGYEVVPANKYYGMRKNRDLRARDDYRNIISKLDIDGLYLSDVMRGRNV